MFGALHSLDGPAADALLAVAADFTPRYQVHGPDDVVLDLAGLERLFGGPEAIAEELCRAAAGRQVRVRVALAGTYTAARLVARSESRAGMAIIEAGAEPAALERLPIGLLTVVENAPPALCTQVVDTVRRWGIRTLGDLAALPADGVAARLGPLGTEWQRLARGEDLHPMRPEVPKERFEQALDLEWPIDGLEPLSFVLGRLLEPLTAHLDRRGRGAAVLHVRLHLVTRTVHERSLLLPAPMRDARTFRTLLLLDLESHPPSAAIDRVVVAVDPTPARIVQLSLLTRPIPSPEQLSTLTARLAALMGEDRCGSPVVVDSWQPGAFAMKPFAPRDSSANPLCPSVSLWPATVTAASNQPSVALRRFRTPIPARVRVECDQPQHVTMDRGAAHFGSRIVDPLGSRPGGGVQACAGPWRTSGGWWYDGRRKHGDTENTMNSLCVSVPLWPVGAWDRDEWDVTLSDGATYRIFRERATNAWFVEGIVD
jgi:protein ImuB